MSKILMINLALILLLILKNNNNLTPIIQIVLLQIYRTLYMTLFVIPLRIINLNQLLKLISRMILKNFMNLSKLIIFRKQKTY